MNEIVTGSFAPCRWQLFRPKEIRVVNWNIDRGLRLPQIADFLAAQQADLLTLQEVDLYARRTHFRNVAEELARKLEMNYVFGREFEELTQGSRGSPAYHGQATLSRWRLMNPRVIRFRDQSGFWRPRWFLPPTKPFQERLGGRIALVAEVEIKGYRCVVYNLHLESRGNDSLRVSQLEEVFEDAARSGSQLPVLVAGDLNMNISRGEVPTLIEHAGFHSVLEEPGLFTRPARWFGSPRSIDWALTSRSVQTTSGQVHSAVSASDHYPISFALEIG